MNKNLESIEVINIKKSFGERQILFGVDVSIKRGEVVGLLGPNGSGKTTLFYIIAGLLYPDSGFVELNQTKITNYPMYKRARMGIGYLPQDVSIFRKMTVEDNIDCVLEIYYKNKKERKQKLDEIIEEFNISHIRKSSALSLSGGERRRVEIARALASNPTFILLDEPFAGVDPIAINDLRTLITRLKNKNIGILITDHNVKETLTILDRAYILYEGNIIFKGTTQEVSNNSKVRELYLGSNFL